MAIRNIYKFLVYLLVTPRSSSKDASRREFILNILLTGLIFLAVAGFIENIIYYYLDLRGYYDYQGINPLYTFVFIAFLSTLLFLSRIGWVKLSSSIFILFLLLSAIYTSFFWGADIPQGLLIDALVIVMSGILIGTQFAFFTTIFISLSLFTISFLQINQIYSPSIEWKTQQYNFADTFVRIITLTIIAIVSWLGNREIEKALRRAWRSEAIVKRQRDKLEITVEKRTKQLKQAQAEKVAQLYRFAQFGKSASGLFHDLANPLTLVSLNLKRLNRQSKQPKLVDAQIALKRAITGTKRLESFVQVARKQIQDQEVIQRFSLKDEINQAIQMLEYRARKSHINILFQPKKDIHTLGNPVKFSQLITNLLSNAMDSYDKVKGSKKQVEIRLSSIDNTAELEIQDWGSGINPKHLPKIFDPLFTTKDIEKGTGIGLSICKDIIEKGFNGSCQVESKKGLGTTFTIEFPIKKS